MKEDILYFLQVITIDFFTAFGLYTILFVLVSIFVKKPILREIDDEANDFIAFVGILYFLFWITAIFVFYIENSPEEKNLMLERMFGKYWIGYWAQPVLWTLLTQLLRIKPIRRNILLRIVFSVLLVISIERYVIIITSFHRDYLPSSWTMYTDAGIYPSNFFFGILAKITLFLCFTGIFYLVKKQIAKVHDKFIAKE